MVKFLRCNKTYAIQVVHVSSSEDSPIKDGITQGKRKMSGNLSKRKLFVAVDDGKKDMVPTAIMTVSYEKVASATSSSLQGSSKGLTPNLWSDVETKQIDKLPFDIDGLVKYQLAFDKERRMESSRDGRPWAGFMTSRRSGFYWNTSTGTFRSGESICHSCGAPAVHIPCPASKVWEFDDRNCTVVVYHHGVHTCVPNAQRGMSKETYDDAASKFQAAKKLGPKAYASSQVIQAVEEGKGIDDVLDLAEDVAPEKISRVKDKLKKNVLQDLKDDIDVEKIVNHCQEVDNVLAVFNTKDKKEEKPNEQDFVNTCLLLLTPNRDMEEMIERAEQFGQAMYLLANHMRVTQTLLQNPDSFASKSQNYDGLDKEFKRNPTVRNMRTFLTSAIVGTHIATSNIRARRDLLNEFGDINTLSISPVKTNATRVNSDVDEDFVESPKKKGRHKEKK
ncbi:hypothetical protein OS493_008453 [Desmophyllum pertusum]|uniref:Uncharacterized protein n=1 Tax=Desmophyllum pertusum TaxID=174260 RepID=A0A9W9ZUQ1_9CNID|nr:hypothetical protein OS493_008453 [Desmophyllum pertusum]